MEKEEGGIAIQGVKLLAEAGISQLPPKFIRPPHERNSIAQCSPHHIPLLDLTHLHGHNRHLLLEQLHTACKQWGFFRVINHGVSARICDRMMEVVNQFFDLPIEEKMVYYEGNILKKGTRYGVSFNAETDEVLEWRDSLRHFCCPLPEVVETWPDKPAAYREIAVEYATSVRHLAEQLLAALSECLELKADRLLRSLGTFIQTLLMNYYPPCPNPELALGLTAHSDISALTVLLQDETTGLQVSQDGLWVDVEPVPNSFIVNVGDVLQVLSNDTYQSVQHRAITNSEKARVSIVMYCAPSLDTQIFPFKELVDNDHPPLFRGFTYADYRTSFYSKRREGKQPLESMRIVAV
ncbi:hypothetical protein O6H91_19G068200 [Diphasiastrum complanatum]|uniref:Uncharacterized protein n=2 Tax=Diphasiastrum complanatum TaxID=34168 RepID=A0ACC2AW93_DIPCM|nr:hypothetical protein O6H91_19G068200 [Diphasiastrum complanatum]KAJ7521795.1 hypothetical protein O6H91_19G068200 [Diphasiastrum complanatum]